MKKFLLAAVCTLMIAALSGCNDIKEVSNKNVNSSTSEKSADLENETDSTSQKENKLSDEALSKLTGTFQKYSRIPFPCQQRNRKRLHIQKRVYISFYN